MGWTADLTAAKSNLIFWTYFRTQIKLKWLPNVLLFITEMVLGLKWQETIYKRLLYHGKSIRILIHVICWHSIKKIKDFEFRFDEFEEMASLRENISNISVEMRVHD